MAVADERSAALASAAEKRRDSEVGMDDGV
jgi:hypothetical protein